MRNERCMNEGRWVLLIASEVGRTDSVSDRAMERLVEAISQEGYEVVRTTTPEDGLSLVGSDPSHSAILLDWDLAGDHQFDERAALKILRAVRRRNKKVPIFLIADRTLVSELPLEVVKQVHEYIHLFGDTPAFIASRVDFEPDRRAWGDRAGRHCAGGCELPQVDLSFADSDRGEAGLSDADAEWLR